MMWHRIFTWIKQHEIGSSLIFIFTVISLGYTIYLTHFTIEQPIEELRSQLSQTVVELRTKIVNVSSGCKADNTYSAILTQENADRVNLNDKLLALGKSTNLTKILGLRLQQQLSCLLVYNDILDRRKDICDGKFLTEEKMKLWEKMILRDIYNKSDKVIDCPYKKTIRKGYNKTK